MSLDIDLALYCRICLQQPKDDALMFTDDEFCAKIKFCTGLQLTQADDLQHKICISCELLLRAALKLRFLCEQTEQQLQRYRLNEKLDTEQAAMVIAKEEKEDVTEEKHTSSAGDSDMQLEYLEAYEVSLDYNEDTDESTVPDVATVPRFAIKCRRKTVDGLLYSSDASSITAAKEAYVCNICSNVYAEKIKLTAHMKVHSEHKPHECEICHKRFRQTPQLARHMNSHTGHRPYKCDFCDSSFADPSTRIKHQRIHTNERPYKCQYCSKAFAYSNVLNVHLKIHTGERPFSCQYCGRRFSQQHHKNTHERAHKASKELATMIVTAEEE